MWKQHSHIFVFVLHFTHEATHFDLGHQSYKDLQTRCSTIISFYILRNGSLSGCVFQSYNQHALLDSFSPYFPPPSISPANLSHGKRLHLIYSTLIVFILSHECEKENNFIFLCRLVSPEIVLCFRFDSMFLIGEGKKRPEKYHEIPIGLLSVIFWSVADQSVRTLCNPSDLLSNKCHCGRCPIVRGIRLVYLDFGIVVCEWQRNRVRTVASKAWFSSEKSIEDQISNIESLFRWWIIAIVAFRFVRWFRLIPFSHTLVVTVRLFRSE